MMTVNERILKAANRLFLLLLVLSVLLLSPWPRRRNAADAADDHRNSPRSVLEWISAHLSSREGGRAASTRAGRHRGHGYDRDANGKFMRALAHGFYDVGIVLVVWYTGMCALGGACRVYLCAEECWNRRLYGVLPLNRGEGEDEDEDEGGEDGDDDGDDASLGDVGMRNLREVGDED